MEKNKTEIKQVLYECLNKVLITKCFKLID